MLYGEFRSKDTECVGCPILDAGLCSGGYTSDGMGTPIEPPCCMFDDDTDMDKWIVEINAQTAAWEAEEDRRIRAAKLRAEKNKSAREKRRREKSCVWHEDYEIKRLFNRIRGNEAAVRLAETFRIVGSMMNGRLDDDTLREKHPLESENEILRGLIAEQEAIKKEKLRVFRKEQKEKEQRDRSVCVVAGKLDKDNIMMIEFEHTIGTIKTERVALFNSQNTTESEAREVVQKYGKVEKDGVVVMTKQQFQKVFAAVDTTVYFAVTLVESDGGCDEHGLALAGLSEVVSDDKALEIVKKVLPGVIKARVISFEEYNAEFGDS